MKLLLDTCVWDGARAELTAAGHDVAWIGDRAVDPGDEEILAQARREQRILITLDREFGELAIRKNLPNCGIVRLVNISARQHGSAALQVLRSYGDEL
jgi:predicted nuclease of predicted toxin-antitoxin system